MRFWYHLGWLVYRWWPFVVFCVIVPLWHVFTYFVPVYLGQVSPGPLPYNAWMGRSYLLFGSFVLGLWMNAVLAREEDGRDVMELMPWHTKRR